MRTSKKQEQRIARTSDIKMIKFFKEAHFVQINKNKLESNLRKEENYKTLSRKLQEESNRTWKSSYQYSRPERFKSQLDIGKGYSWKVGQKKLYRIKHRNKIIEDMEARLRDTKDRTRSSKTLNQGAKRE